MLTKKDNLKNDAKTNKNPQSTTPETQHGSYQPLTPTSQTDRKGSQKTRVTIKYDVGFSNQFFIRGKGANLSWDKGQPLKNTKPDEWTWETDVPFSQCEFKILINDRVYENGENHTLNSGASISYTPHFY